MCAKCLSRDGKVGDLDIAIRASGDSPERIPEWAKIRHFLRNRFGDSQSYAGLWERCVGWLQAEHNLLPEDYLRMSITELLNLLSRQVEIVPTEKQPKKATVNERKAGVPALAEEKPTLEAGEPRQTPIDTKALIVAALNEHHGYSNGNCKKDVGHVGVNKLAKYLSLSPSTVSVFFKKEFGGHDNYRIGCGNLGNLAKALKILNGELTPGILYNSLGDNDGNLADE